MEKEFSKRRKISSSTHSGGLTEEEQCCTSSSQQVMLKNHGICLPGSIDNGVDDNFIDDDDDDLSNWLDTILTDDPEMGISPSGVIDGGLVAGGLLNEEPSMSNNCDPNVGMSDGFSMENHDFSVSQSGEDILTFDGDGFMGKGNGVEEAGGKGAALDTSTGNDDGNEHGFDTNVDESFGNSTCSNSNLFDSTSIDNSDQFQNPLKKQFESQDLGVFVPYTTICGNSRNNPSLDMLNNGKMFPSRGNGTWVPVGSDVVPCAAYCPDALVDYLHGADSRKLKDHNSIVTKVRMHLLHLGWKIEGRRGETTSNSSTTFRYISPDGKTIYSLMEVCRNLTQTMNLSHNSRIDNRNSVNVDKPLGSRVLDRQQGYEGGVSTFHEKSPSSGVHKTERGQVGNGSSSVRSETPALDLCKDKKAPMDLVPDETNIEPEYCPQAVIDWCNYESDRKNPKLVSQSGTARTMSLKAKKHLVSVGWKLWHIVKQKKKLELRYTSPKGKHYISLVRACKGYMEEEGFLGSMGPTEGMVAIDKSKGPSNREKFSSATASSMGNESQLPINRQFGKGFTELCGSSKSKELERHNIQTKGISRHQEKQKNTSFPLSSKLVQNQTSVQQVISVPSLHNNGLRGSSDHNVSTPEKKEGEISRPINRVGDRLDSSYQTCPSRSTKRARQVTVPSSIRQIPRTILTWLIDNNVVLPRAKVYCKGGKDHSRVAYGRVTPEGIRCNCCQKVFSLTKFAAHAGSTNCRPAASIFLEDGRSLFQCQTQIVGRKLTGLAFDPLEGINRNNPPDKNDEICSVCNYGGNILLCDRCPSSFHLSCLGLKEYPEGSWFCPSCRCGICEQSEFDDTENFTEKTVLFCDQCEHEYHVGCIRQRDQVKLESHPEGNWFCSTNCEKIFAGLHDLLGKSFPVGVNNLSWTILKASKDDHQDIDESYSETIVENHSKLSVALSVMHECFEPIKLPQSERDLVEAVLFNRQWDMNRLNFRGFYTVLLEKDDELVSVAIMRVHGKHMAEVPLVGTRVQYRQQGMCHILMNVIEKTLAEFEVKRLILPATVQTLMLWTTSFGFSMMSSLERLKFLEYTFLNFQDTTMCQKILMPTPIEKSTEFRDDSKSNDSNVDIDRNSVGSEVIQAERIEQTEVVDQHNSRVNSDLQTLT